MERIAPLTVVEASAGTGKTYALVTRLLTLIFCGVEPEKIVALTFSRLAAGEIFNTFIERLSKAAETPKGAAKESGTLNLGRQISQAEFAAMLRKVIAHQHLSLIGTLDSFLMRVIRMVPFELGLAGEITVMSDYRSPLERSRLVGDMLMLDTPDAKDVFRKAFREVFSGVGTQSFLAEFSKFIANWHARYRDHLDKIEWGSEERIWGAEVPRRPEISLMEIRLNATKFALMKGKNTAIDNFIKVIANYGGETPPKIPAGLAKDPLAHAVVKKMWDYRISETLRTTRGIYDLMWIFERAYASTIRARGLISFDDLPRLLMGLSEETRLALEYRMDARFDHWALDEFQDTSRGQWNAIRNLIEENSLPDGNKTVFIVGDRKQSIYEWRAGDVRILGEQVELARKAPNRLLPLDESYRYRSEISFAVNKVFETSVIRGLFEMDDAPANAVWECREHESHDKVNEGFVEVSEAPKAAKGKTPAENFFEPVANALRAVKPWERGITCAILVRTNNFGMELLAYLKQNGFADHVVFEGDMPIFDSPVLGAFAALLKLAEHADDTYAYAQIKYSPLAKALYPNGLPPLAELSAALLADFTRLGMVRKFRGVREALKGVPDSWDEDFTESRFEDFIKCAAEFEDMREANMRLSDFIDFVKQKNSRDFADANKVRILTMHRSKGLGFDYVIIPFYESDGLSGNANPNRLAPLTQENPAWVLKHPGVSTAESDPVLSAAERRRKQSEIYASLCLNYVAMTRAKKALTLILHPANKGTKGAVPNRFSDLVREVGLKTFGNPAWYLEEGRRVSTEEAATETAALAFKRPSRQSFAKVRPGEAFQSGIRGDTLFMETFGAAAERGTQLHEEFAKIEWLPESAAKSPFEKALVKPEGAVELWRERAYELITEGSWQSGQFDRVVFVGEGVARRATIYDFKTNALQSGESAESFAVRMTRTYAHQMRTYRAALASLTGLPLTSISTTLLLHATHSAVAVN